MSSVLVLTHEFPPFLGGIGTYACQLAAAAQRSGHEVTVSAPDHGGGSAEEADARYPFRVVRFHGGRYSDRSLPSVVLRNRRLIDGGRFDVVHAADWPNTLAMGLLNRYRRVPFVATVYGTEVLGSAQSRLTRLLCARRVFEAPDRVFAISEFTRDLLLGHFPGVDPGRVVVTPLGVSAFWSEPTLGAAVLRDAYQIPRGNRIILTASRLDPRKGHRLALRALARLPAARKAGLSYVIVGAGDDHAYLRELRTLADEAGVQVVFTGPVSDADLREFYGDATAFLMPGETHPKKVEGFGLVFLEAAARGLPSVTSDVGAAAEVVLHGRTGLVVPPADVEALTGALVRLLSDESFRSDLGRAARAASVAYTWERCASMTYGAPGTTLDTPARTNRIRRTGVDAARSHRAADIRS